MPRAPPGLPLLLILMAGLASSTTTATTTTTTTTSTTTSTDIPSLEIVNPWLSACDLQPNSATDLKGACLATWGLGSLCPPPCPHNMSSSNTQCLYYLKESHKEEVCGPGKDPERRRAVLHTLRMRHCCEHAVDTALPEEVLRGGDACRRLMGALLDVDALAARISCEFAEVLTRYDCGQVYSIAHRCEDCKEAYRRWACSSLVPHFTNAGQRIRPCRTVCQDVEQQCPYMLPGDRAPSQPTQYAGEPTFLCLDPNIPETGDQRRKSSSGDEDCCYTHCGSPGRGLCEHCPGRPTTTNNNATPKPVNCSTDNTIKASGCWTSAAPTIRTLNKVFLLWTAWIISIQTNLISNILQCFLVLCATSVQRTMWIKTKRRPACS